MKRALVVEDEPAVADVIEVALRRSGLEVEVASSRSSALACLQRAPGFSVVVLDLGLPDGDGMELCRWLRSRDDAALNSMPIVMVTCRDEEIDRVVGLEVGADDYLVKPFSPRELAARVASVLRRAHNQFGKDAQLSRGPLVLSRIAFQAAIDGQIVPLTKTEFELLWTLFVSPERVFTREVLVERSYENTTVSQRTVDSHIKGIRQKCLALATPWDPIQTVYGVGYKAAST